jgi:uncharacterized delta-60 repeat protein
VVGKTATDKQLAVYRYLPNGQLDPIFSHDGQAIYPDTFNATDVALQSDGKIMVGGYVANGTQNTGFHLARLTASGALDPSFGFDGWVQDLDSDLGMLLAILVQPDDKTVVCGSTHVGFNSYFGITRYTARGVRDTSFGSNGKVTISFSGSDWCLDLARQSDGKLVAVGASQGNSGNTYDFAVIRLEANGRLDDDSDGDGGFGSGGKLTTDFGGNESATAIAIQPDGKIVVIGHDNFLSLTSYIARYLPNGALDGSFGSGGKRIIPTDRLSDLALQPDGKFLALGDHPSPDNSDKFVLHRLLPNGAPDSTFGQDGAAWPEFGGQDEGQALALLPDGRILVAGRSNNVGILARLWPNGSFDIGGQQTHSLTFAPTYRPGYWEAVKADAFVTRFQANGLPDLSFGTNGSAFCVQPTIC